MPEVVAGILLFQDSYNWPYLINMQYFKCQYIFVPIKQEFGIVKEGSAKDKKNGD